MKQKRNPADSRQAAHRLPRAAVKHGDYPTFAESSSSSKTNSFDAEVAVAD